MALTSSQLFCENYMHKCISNDYGLESGYTILGICNAHHTVHGVLYCCEGKCIAMTKHNRMYVPPKILQVRIW